MASGICKQKSLDELLGVSLKTEQREALNYAKENDVLCVLPTGFGKSKIIEGLIHLNDGVVLVINGLTGLLEQQKKSLPDSFILTAEWLRKVSSKDRQALDESQCLTQGAYRFILAHPEVILQPDVKKILMTSPLSDKISHVVVDEAHCILAWGQSNFRPAYKDLGTLRAIIPSAKIVALTATATQKGQKEIAKSLYMHKPSVISASPDRPNVFLEVKRRPPSTGVNHTAEDSIFSCVDPILEELSHKGNLFPKTIIYMPLKWCGIVHDRAITHFKTEKVAQYHAPQSHQMKLHIAHEMHKKTDDSTIRVLLATEAYGMGMDVPDIVHIVHVSPPSSLETFVQEIGRCGRNGQPSKSTLYYNNSDLGRPHLQDGVSNYIKTEDCRRSLITQYFGFSCGACNSNICCDNCMMHISQELCAEKLTALSVSPFSESYTVEQKKQLQYMLKQYFESENRLIASRTPAHLITGLTQGLIDSICTKVSSTEISDLKIVYPFLSDQYINNISAILKCIK